MAERLGLGIIPGVGWRASEIRTVAREAEDAGFDAIVTTEVNNDSLATAQLMGEATRQIKVGTWICDGTSLKDPNRGTKSVEVMQTASSRLRISRIPRHQNLPTIFTEK